jgi:hypothetical protein
LCVDGYSGTATVDLAGNRGRTRIPFYPLIPFYTPLIPLKVKVF